MDSKLLQPEIPDEDMRKYIPDNLVFTVSFLLAVLYVYLIVPSRRDRKKKQIKHESTHWFPKFH